MTRQIALGAIIAFGLTVLALSVWEPKPVISPPPPAPAPVVAPRMEKPFHPATLRPELTNRMIFRQPVVLMQMVDAGAP